MRRNQQQQQQQHGVPPMHAGGGGGVGGAAGTELLMDASVLQETRNLLNSLNDENSELKAQSEHVTLQWRHATAELEAERRRFAQLEHDSKQINTNLVKQLQARAAEAKGAQQALDALERRSQSMELQLERLAEEKAAAEDRCLAVQRQLQEAVGREERERSDKADARMAADRAAGELAAAVAAQRERALASERTLAQQCEQLTLELKRQQDLAAAARRHSEQQAADHARSVEGMQRRLEQAQQQAQRTQHAEAESGFAHEAMQETAEAFFETLSDLHARTRAAEIDAAETMNYIARITAKFRAVAQAAATQRRNSEEVVSFYARAYEDAKAALTAASAENAMLRNSLSGTVEGAVAQAERQARDAAIRAERSHQEQLASAIGEMEAKQRERDGLAKELQRHKDSLRESHETERQLRAFSEQLYADVVAANKVATEATEKERAARAELTTLEHRVAEQVRRELGAAFEAERSKLSGQLASAKAAYELEIAEMRAQLDENADTLHHALQRMTSHNHHQARSASSVQQSQQPQQQQNSVQKRKTSPPSFAAAGENPNATVPQQQQQQSYYSASKSQQQQSLQRSSSAPFAFEQQGQHLFHQQLQQQYRSASYNPIPRSASSSANARSPELSDFLRSQLGGKSVSLEGVDVDDNHHHEEQQRAVRSGAGVGGSSQYYQEPVSCSPVRNPGVIPAPQPHTSSSSLTAAQQQYRSFQQQKPFSFQSTGGDGENDASSPSQLRWPSAGGANAVAASAARR